MPLHVSSLRGFGEQLPRLLLVVAAMLASASARATGKTPQPPLDLGANHAEATGINYASAAVTLPDGTLESYFRRSHTGRVSIFAIRSADDGRTWEDPRELVPLEVAPWGGPMPLLDRDGELHFVIPRVRGEGRRPAIDRFIDLYHVRSHEGRTQWSEPQRIFEGYLGAIQCLVQLKNGRIIAPFADWIAGRPTTPPTGPSVTTTVYSDDGGTTWQRSPAALTAPCYDGYNGANYGACEPTILELQDGRVWMLIRTQAGFLYESYSQDGITWSEARPSRFYSSNSPAFPIRLPDGRIVMFWNNCQMPPRVDGQGVYAGRDALHAAISTDDGVTWRGFREVYRDPTRNGSPPKDGDRGTAYPHATLTKDGKIVLVSGQGENRRRRFLIDPEWLLETEASDDLEDLEAWHVFKGFGPAARFWRDRQQGPLLVAHPERPGDHVLQLGRVEEAGLDPDGATWNFPAGRRGSVRFRLQLLENFAGGQVSLIDRFLDPSDDQGEQFAAFAWQIDDRGQIAPGVILVPGQWNELELIWNVETRSCELLIDGKLVARQGLRGETPFGVSYLRLRCADEGGMRIDAVRVKVE